MRYRLLFLLSLIAVIAYVQRLSLSVAGKRLESELEITKEQLGDIFSAFFLGYAVLQLPSGWMADRWGSRVMVALFALASSAFTASAGLGFDAQSLMVLWFLLGLAQAGLFPCAAKAIGQWIPDTERAFASGVLGSSMALGSALGPVLSASILQATTWQNLCTILAIPGCIWAFSYLLVIPEPSAAMNARSVSVAKPEAIWGEILVTPAVWLLCAQQFLRAAGMVFFFTWFPTYLREARGTSEMDAGWFTTYTGIAAMAGGVLGGLFSDFLLRTTGLRWWSRQGQAVVGMCVCSLAIFLSFAQTNLSFALFFLSVGAFAGTFGGVSGYTVAIELGGKYVASVFSLMNMFGNLGAMFLPATVGRLVKSTGSWDIPIFLFGAVFAIDAVCWALLRPKYVIGERPNPRRKMDH